MTDGQIERNKAKMERYNRIAELYRKGCRVSEITQSIPCGTCMVYRALDYMGVKTHRDMWNDKHKAVLTDYMNMVPVKEIRKKHCVTTRNVQDAKKWARKHGIRVPNIKGVRQMHQKKAEKSVQSANG